jgi:hypothetical protein
MRKGLSLKKHNAALSLRLRPEIWRAVSAAMVQKNYHLKSRSRWVSEAIDSLFDSWIDLSITEVNDTLKLHPPLVANIPPVRIKLSPSCSRQLKHLGGVFEAEGREFSDFRTRVACIAIRFALKQQGINYRTFVDEIYVSTVETIIK